jgi:hypothetical protein
MCATVGYSIHCFGAGKFACPKICCYFYIQGYFETQVSLHNFALTVDDIPYQPKEADKESPASCLTLHYYFVDSAQLSTVIPDMAPKIF